MAAMQMGIQLHLPTYNKTPIPDLIKLGKDAKAGGISQIWVTDNLRSRNAFVVLAALASNIPINLGTAVTVQYFRNPVDVADSVAAISEIMDGTELSIGLARGNPSTPSFVDSPKPVSMLRETAQCLNQLLAGEEVKFSDYPVLASYFKFRPEAKFRLNFDPKTPIRLYCGGNAPLSLAVGGETMDGLIVGGEFKAVANAGQLPALLSTFDDAATKAGKSQPGPKIAEIKLSVSKNREAAREFAKHSAGNRLLNLRRRKLSGEDIQRLGVPSEDLDLLEQAVLNGATTQEFTSLVTDPVTDAIFVAGDPGYCREQMIQVAQTAKDHGFNQLMFSELGPNVEESLRILCDEIIVAL